jgi:hypothetical protein
LIIFQHVLAIEDLLIFFPARDLLRFRPEVLAVLWVLVSRLPLQEDGVLESFPQRNGRNKFPVQDGGESASFFCVHEDIVPV